LIYYFLFDDSMFFYSASDVVYLMLSDFYFCFLC